jgi:hypothetical protein
MPKLVLFLSLLVSSLSSFAMDPKILFHWNDLKESEDRIKFFKLELDREKFEAELALTQYQMDQRLFSKGALTELNLKKSEKNSIVHTASVMSADLKVRERLIDIEIKKQTLAAWEGKKISVKFAAQLYADDWKAKLEMAKLLLRIAQAELDYNNYHYDVVKRLNSKEMAQLEEVLEVLRDKQQSEASVSMLIGRLKSLQETTDEAQKIADQITE